MNKNTTELKKELDIAKDMVDKLSAEKEAPVQESTPAPENKVMGNPSINDYSNEEVILDQSNPPMKQLFSKLFLLLQPDVEEFYSDKHKLNAKLEKLYVKYSNVINSCKQDIEKANKRLEEATEELRKAEREFQEHNINDFDPGSFDTIVAPKAQLFETYERYVTFRSKELNRLKFVKTKLFAKEKNISKFVQHVHIVYIMMMSLKELDYENPFDKDKEIDKYNQLEEIRNQILASDEYLSIPDKFDKDSLDAIVHKYASTYLSKKKQVALEHSALSSSFLNDVFAKYIGTEIPEPKEVDNTEDPSVTPDMIIRRIKAKQLKALLSDTSQSLTTHERDEIKTALDYNEFWCENEGVNMVMNYTNDLEPLIYDQVVSVFNRKIVDMSHYIFKDEPHNKAEYKMLMCFLCTTLSDSIELCLGLL